MYVVPLSAGGGAIVTGSSSISGWCRSPLQASRPKTSFPSMASSMERAKTMTMKMPSSEQQLWRRLRPRAALAQPCS